MAITGLHHIGVICGDIDASLDFYLNKLGFELDRRIELSATTQLVFIHAGSCSIELICKGVKEARGEGQVAHICMQVDDIASTVENLRGKGIAFAAETYSMLPALGENAANIFFAGPDGETLELFQ